MKVIHKPSLLRKQYYFYCVRLVKLEVIEFQSKRRKGMNLLRGIHKSELVNNEYD